MSEQFEAMKARLRDQGLIAEDGVPTALGREYTDQLIVELRRATVAGNNGNKPIRWRWKQEGPK